MTSFDRKWTFKQFIKVTSTTIFSMIFVSLYTMIDGIFISQKLGPIALGALNIVLPAYNFIFGTALMIVVGSSAIIGINLGENKYEEANKKFTLTICLLILLSLIYLIIGLGFSDKIVSMLGASEAMMPYAKKYLFIMCIFSFAFAFNVFTEFFLRLDGKFNLAMTGTLVGGLSNIVLDYLFIYKLNMGIAGAAYGTVLGAAIISLIGIGYFLTGKCKLKIVKPEIDFKFIKELLLNGSSEMVSSIASGVTTFLFNITLLKMVGDLGVSSISILLYLNFFLSSFYIGLSMGAQPIISYNYGAKKTNNVKDVLKISCSIIVVVSIITFIMCQTFGQNLVRIFEKSNAEVINLTTSALYIFSLSFLINGFNILASAFFTSVNNGKISAIIAFGRSLVFTVIGILILPKLFDITGVWITIPIAEVLTLGLSIMFYLRNRDKYLKVSI